MLCHHFLGETLTLLVLDSGYTKIAGEEKGLKCYVESLCDNDDKKKIKGFNSDAEFKFADKDYSF